MVQPFYLRIELRPGRCQGNIIPFPMEEMEIEQESMLNRRTGEELALKIDDTMENGMVIVFEIKRATSAAKNSK